MLKVIIEIHPFGESENKKTISEYIIGNKGHTGNDDECIYHCWQPNHEGYIEIKHFRKDGAEKLVTKLFRKIERLK